MSGPRTAGRPTRTDTLLALIDELVAEHGEHDAARLAALALSPAEARAYAGPFLLALARRTSLVTDPLDLKECMDA